MPALHILSNYVNSFSVWETKKSCLVTVFTDQNLPNPQYVSEMFYLTTKQLIVHLSVCQLAFSVTVRGMFLNLSVNSFLNR